MARMQASTPEPVYGMSRISSSSWTVPSSPSRPCMAMNATSGARVAQALRSGRRRRRSRPPRGRAAPARPRTRAPERSDTWRSSERPPLRTATRLTSPSPAARARRAPADAARCRRRASGRSHAHRRPLAGERPVQLDLLGRPPRRCGGCPRGSRPRREPEKLSRIELRPRPSRKAASPGTKATFSRSARASRSVVSMKSGSVAQMNRPPAGRVHSACAREVLGERVEHRVAPGAVDLRERLDVVAPAALARSRPGPSAARASRCRGRPPACRG